MWSAILPLRRTARPLVAVALIVLSAHARAVAPSPSRRPQGDELLAREEDERAATSEGRRRALADLTESAERTRAAGDAPAGARLLNRAGNLQLWLNSPRDALKTFGEALSALGGADDATTRVDSLNGVGAAYGSLSECDRAEEALGRALRLSERSSYTAGRAEALLTLSNCQNYGDHALALRTAQESLSLWRSVDQKWGAARALRAVGEYQLALNDLEDAASSYEASLDLWRELGRADEQAEALISLGFVEYRRGAWQNVLSLLTRAQGLLDEKSAPEKMGQIAAGLAEAFIESGMPETGLVKLRQALEYYRETQNPRYVIVIEWDIGKAHYLLGDYPAAQAELQGALQKAQEIKDPAVAAMCDEFLGRTLAAMGDRPAAMARYEGALGLYAKVGDRMEAARTKALMGQLLLQEGKVEQARSLYLAALASFRTLADRVNESAALYALGNLELARERPDVAEGYLRQSIEATENIRRIPTSSDLTAALSATLYGRYEKYVECLMRLRKSRPAEGLDVRAFETSELARGRSLAELLRATGTGLAPGLDPQLAEREKSLRQSLREKEDYKVGLLSKAYKKEELAALDAEQARLEEEYGRVVAALRARYPSYGVLTGPAAWSLRQIQERVVADDETVLLEYSLGEDVSYVWAVTRDGIGSYELPGRAPITEAAQKVYGLLSSPPDAGAAARLQAATRDLSRMVLSPAAGALGRRRIVVVADGPLNYIPFQILSASPSDDEPLVEGHEVVNAPSATVLGELRDEAASRPAPAKVLAAFGDPIFAPDRAPREELASAPDAATGRWRGALRDIELKGDSFDPSSVGPLFYAKRELSDLREVAGGGAFVASDFAATREQLLRTDLTQYAILHFATHGLLDPKRPENSGLLLSTVDRAGHEQNGFVGLEDVYALRAPVDLVVLSACRTGLGREVRGEGLIGLTRGFMYAGASTVVASLWKVDDEATAELMRRFYKNMLKGGMSPAAALRAAQNSVRQNPDWAAPYYWAAFTVQGEYRAPIRASRPRMSPPTAARAFASVCSVLSLAAAAAWWRRRRRAHRPLASYSTVK